MSQSEEIISLAWRLYSEKVASTMLNPRNEKMMQLQLAQILQLLAPLYEARSNESYKVHLEHPVHVADNTAIIDIVLEHSMGSQSELTAIELKCYRLYSNNSEIKKRGAQNLGMYDYWADIENCEKYCMLLGFKSAYQLTVTDDSYYVNTLHTGEQVRTYSTNKHRKNVTGVYQCRVANRDGYIHLQGIYELPWISKGNFHFIAQAVHETVYAHNLDSPNVTNSLKVDVTENS